MEKELILKRLGEIVKSKRNKLNISQEELAFKCGFDRTYISLVERGLRNITFTNLLILSKGLDTNISSLTKDL
ncbi:MAG: helix-turn-helix transcriptional regulator [Paludibacteraceae bacterium]|nr:helix-turn-helix transcriptional regulator [Paludibacteraceae bacterium]MBN2787799.1 helix-turn-helix transcriptional regulator [Paludibacteraceae bacterium]